jgi:hypothetical protein
MELSCPEPPRLKWALTDTQTMLDLHLLGADYDEVDIEFVPTFRIINVRLAY